jgi:hypothetical protein
MILTMLGELADALHCYVSCTKYITTTTTTTAAAAAAGGNSSEQISS